MADAVAQGSIAFPVGVGEQIAEAQELRGEGALDAGADLAGKLYRGEQDGTVHGWLYDHRTARRAEFRGFRDPRPRKGGYILVGRVVP